jgi:beta-lactamase regulating signal transducer with metallopeptidase domain/uncharacterized protein YnzC (UPF0291/DUF896 family)
MNSWQLLLELTLKALLILAAAGLLTVLLRNTSAALRHTVWSLALGGLLLLPLLTLVVPAWRVAILPAPDCAPNCESSTLPPTPAMIEAESLIVPAMALEPNAMVPEPDVVAPPSKSATVTVQSFSMIQIAFLIWALGVALVLARLALGTLRMWRITREAEFLTDYHWSALTNRLRGELDLRSHVSVYASDEIAMPVTWGVLQPVIVLPADANEWSAEWRRIVLLHELAHIKRRDCLTQMLANVVCALYWFNPLVWFAAQRLRVERELACDDCVLEVGTRASDYASYLVEIAKSFDAHEPATPVTVGMACSQLESRVRAILDPALNRRNLSRNRKAALLLAMACALLPLASLQATSQVKPHMPAPPAPPAAPDAPEITENVASSIAKLEAQQDKLAALQERAANRELSAPEKLEMTRVQQMISMMQDELRGTLAMVSPPDPPAPPAPAIAPAPAPFPMPMPSVKAVTEISPEMALIVAAMQDAQQKDKSKEEGLTADNLVRLKVHNVTPEYVEAIKKAGYDDISVRQIVELKAHDVTPEFIKQAQGMSSEKLSAREIVQLKISGLKPEYISAMKQAGYENLPIRKLSNMRIMGVTPEYAAAMKRAGFDNLTADQLTQLKTHDVTEEYVKQVQGWGIGKLSVRDVMEIKIHGVKPEDAATLKAMGFANPSLRDLTQVRMFGVTESYVKELRGLGLDNLTLRQVLQLKQHGVDSEYIRKMRAAGFKNISANDLIKMRTQGIDTILLKN